MSVIAMHVVSTVSHPNADALRVYTMEAPQRPTLQVVANMENVYQVGDVVAVAQVGAKLLDGTRIRRSKLRGVESLGMAMGTVDCPVGTDLTAEYCIVEPVAEDKISAFPEGLSVVKWTKIEQLHHVLRHLEGRRDFVGDQFVFPKIDYRAKVKLDGTNGGIHILASGDVVAQSRSRLLTLDDDNLGFAAWVKDNEGYFRSLGGEHEHVILYGEWCGQGIQKRSAISKIGRRIFVVFAIQYGDHSEVESTIDIEPARIRAFLPEHEDVHVLPWQGDVYTFDFGDREQLKSAAETINQLVLDVEATDPWVAAHFDVEGIGEGVVMYPLLDGYADAPIPRERCTEFMYKAKGEKHQVVKQKKAVQIDPEVAHSIDAFVDMFLTEERLEQGVREGCDGSYDAKQTGLFLKWIGQDIKQEGAAELEASGLAWKDVSKAVMSGAKQWFSGKSKAL